jgi:hypothetical protein
VLHGRKSSEEAVEMSGPPSRSPYDASFELSLRCSRTYFAGVAWVKNYACLQHRYKCFLFRVGDASSADRFETCIESESDHERSHARTMHRYRAKQLLCATIVDDCRMRRSLVAHQAISTWGVILCHGEKVCDILPLEGLCRR